MTNDQQNCAIAKEVALQALFDDPLGSMHIKGRKHLSDTVSFRNPLID
jgi:hypothetical protein